MKSSQRVLVNTFAQYTRTVINMILSLYTVRLVLLMLGASDYGIYTLIAGVIAMLSFVTNSLVSTTQRFVSFYQGKGVLETVKEVFNNSLLLHITIGIVVALLLLLLTPVLFNGFLNIPPERGSAAITVYYIVTGILFLTFVTSPFRALLISHENIVYISAIDVIDGVLKVILVTLISFASHDKLVMYAFAMLAVQLFNFIALSVYCYLKYVECVLPDIRRINLRYLKELFSFAGWSIYSAGCIVGRQQGIAVVLNKIMGTVVNAAYGIGFQIAGYTNFLSSSLVNAITPQIVKSEGSGNRERALWLSNVTSKFIFFLLSAVCIPCMFEIDEILVWWLKEVPNNANLFCIMVMLALLVDSLTVGLAYINQAIGKIGLYSVMVNTPKLLTLPLAVPLVKGGYPLSALVFVYVAIEFICALLRIPFIHKTAGLDAKLFFRDVTLKEVLPLSVCVSTCYFITNSLSFQYRFLVTIVVAVSLYALSIYLFGLTKREKVIINDIMHTVLNKTHSKNG